MADAVFTWVDGSDPKHFAKRHLWMERENKGLPLKKGMAATRFSCQDEIWFSIRLLRKNAPWIERIFLVTDEQCPEWLMEKEQRDLGVILVDHKTIFRGFEECLPTFNSVSIETLLHHIPDISDQFLYLNDDFFLIHPTVKSDYFMDRKSVWRGRWRNTRSVGYRIEKSADRLLRKINIPLAAFDGFIGRRAEKELLSEYGTTFFPLAHAPYPIDRRLMAQALRDSRMVLENIQHRFRSETQFFPMAYIAHLGFDKDLFLAGPDDWRYISCSRHSDRFIRNKLRECETDSLIKSLCVQSLDSASADIQDHINNFLQIQLER